MPFTPKLAISSSNDKRIDFSIDIVIIISLQFKGVKHSDELPQIIERGRQENQ